MSPIFTILALIGICISVAISNTFLYAQKMINPITTKIVTTGITTPVYSSSTKLKTIATNVALIPTVKILSSYTGQKVPATDNLVVSGTSSYDRSKDCRVSVLLNGVKPYQKTIATGNNGINDYSTWKYKLDPNYTVIREGSNKLTAKITCLGNPHGLSKWTSVNLIGTREDNDHTATGVAQPMPLQISISVDKNPITAGDIQTIIVKVHSPGITNSAISGAKVSGQVIDLSSFSSSSSSFPPENTNTVVEQFGGNTDKNGEVSYSWKIPGNTPIGTPYIIKAEALSGKYDGRSESNIFTVKTLTNDNPFILAQASKNFTNGLNNNIKNFTQEIFDKVTNSLENNLK